MESKKYCSFESGQDMLDVIQDGVDLYNPEEELYVFAYNGCGSICVYEIERKKSYELSVQANENNEYWGAYLGWGGSIYDDESYEDIDEYSMLNIDWCNENYKGKWFDTRYWEDEYERRKSEYNSRR